MSISPISFSTPPVAATVGSPIDSPIPDDGGDVGESPRGDRETTKERALWWTLVLAIGGIVAGYLISAVLKSRRKEEGPTPPGIGGDGGDDDQRADAQHLESVLRGGVGRRQWRRMLGEVVETEFGGDREKAAEATARHGIDFRDLRGRGRRNPVTGDDVAELARAEDGFAFDDGDAERLRTMWLMYRAGGRVPAKPHWHELSRWFSTVNSLNAGKDVGYDGPAEDALIVQSGNQLLYGPRELQSLGLLAHLVSYWESTKDAWISQMAGQPKARDHAEDFSASMNGVHDMILRGRWGAAANLMLGAGEMFVHFDPPRDELAFVAVWNEFFALYGLNLGGLCVQAFKKGANTVEQLEMAERGSIVISDAKPLLYNEAIMRDSYFEFIGHKKSLVAIREHADMLRSINPIRHMNMQVSFVPQVRKWKN